MKPASTLSRPVQFILFAAGCVWLFLAETVAARVANNIAFRWNLGSLETLIEQASLILLLLLGFTAIAFIASRSGTVRSANALPKRPTATTEWLGGVALGWGMLLAAVFPMMLFGALHPQFSWRPSAWGISLLSLATIALTTLALELAFRGFLYIRLIAAVGQVIATVLLALFYAVLSTFRPNATATSVVVTFLLGLLLSLAYQRTHALWFGWGLHFSWNATMAILFGLPIAGLSTDGTVVSTSVSGHDWLTGGAYGPESALLTIAIVLLCIPPLYRLTRDYAWHYTHEPILPAAYAAVIAPPAAHTEMETATTANTPLVQIISSTSTASSTLPAIDEHLRATQRSHDTTP
jgi:membrane protease YdiL (CAAX protease family)